MPVIDEDRIRDLIGDFQKDHAELLRKVERLEEVLIRLSEKGAEVPSGTEAVLRDMVVLLQGEFLAHCREDELLLYPLLRPYVGTDHSIPDLVAEHAILQEEVDEFVKAFGQMVRRGAGIAELVRRHIQHEESILWDLAKRVRPPAEPEREEGYGEG
jgi:hemerythrin-like domain-containing protein